MSAIRRIAVTGVTKGIAEVVLTSDNKLNMQDNQYFDDLYRSMSEVSNNAEARVAILRAEGKMFCAGLDLKSAAEMFFADLGPAQKAKVATAVALAKVGVKVSPEIKESGMPAMRNQTMYNLIGRWQTAVSSIEQCRVPVIAAIHGKCIGGGVDVITAADFRVCTKDSVFSVREAKVAITADLGTLQRLSRLVGEGRAREYAYTARDINADEALKVGLVNHVYDSVDELKAKTQELAASIAANSPLAVQGTKRVLNNQSEEDIKRSLEFVKMWNVAHLKSDDLVEAFLAFAQKGEPNYDCHIIPPPPFK
eukprot:PhF_6_TR19181/c0_g1_i1/m.28210